VAYEEFGCNDGNVFFMGIDKGNTNYDVTLFKSTYGIQFPGVSGDEGGGNAVHQAYDIQATPSVVVIAPDKAIASHWIWPPNATNIVDSVLLAGGIQQECITGMEERPEKTALLTIHENPIQDQVHFTIHPGSSKVLEVVIRNLEGRKVAGLAPAPYDASGQTAWIDMNGLPDGLYFIQLMESGQKADTRKIILKR
jgi:hypothetical protein